MTNKTPQQQKEILKKHYTLDEICEILGFYDGSNEDVCTEELETLYANAENSNEPADWNAFEDKILDAAIINGNFEEVIEKDERHAL